MSTLKQDMQSLDATYLKNLLNDFSKAAKKKFQGCGEEFTAWNVALSMYFCESKAEKEAYLNEIIKGEQECQP